LILDYGVVHCGVAKLADRVDAKTSRSNPTLYATDASFTRGSEELFSLIAHDFGNKGSEVPHMRIHHRAPAPGDDGRVTVRKRENVPFAHGV